VVDRVLPALLQPGPAVGAIDDGLGCPRAGVVHEGRPDADPVPLRLPQGPLVCGLGIGSVLGGVGLARGRSRSRSCRERFFGLYCEALDTVSVAAPNVAVVRSLACDLPMVE
jgi:hypothetical protein